MSKFTDKELKRYAVISAIAGFVGLILLMTAQTIHNEATFWAPYTAAFKGISWLIILVCVMWFGMSMAYLHTSFFSVKEPLSTDKAILHIAVIVIIMFISGYYAITSLPNTPPERQPLHPQDREHLLARESRDRLYTSVLVLAFGAAFAAFPCMRCFGPDLFSEKKETAEESS